MKMKALSLVFVSALMLVSPSWAESSAADVEEASASVTGDEAIDDRIERFRALRAKAREINALAENATEQDRLALERKVEDVSVEFVALAHELSAYALDEQKPADIRKKARTFADEAMASFSEPLFRHIDRIDREVAATNEEIQAAEGAAALDAAHDLSTQSHRADRLYDLTADQAVLLDELGIQSGELREELGTRLTRRAELSTARISVAEDARARLDARLRIDPTMLKPRPVLRSSTCSWVPSSAR